jgi:deoxyribose-phosphate aldolase
MNKKTLAQLIDHTLLRPDASYAAIRKLCEEALQFGFHSVCVYPYYTEAVKELLKGSNVRITTVIGFPSGMTTTDEKVLEAMNAARTGADELDFVINIGALKSGTWDVVTKDISDVIAATKGLIHKVIIETCYLTTAEKRRVVAISLNAGAEFIKTSTGLGPKGAQARDIRLIKSIVGDKAGIKAAGGIRTLKQVLAMLDAGASRIGTSSSLKIIEGLRDFEFRD